MQPYDTTDLKAASQVDWEELGYPVTGSPDSSLDLEIGRALGYLVWVTGRDYTNEDDLATGSHEETMFNQCLQLRVEQQIFQRQNDYQSDFHNDVNEISVTGYSENRVSYKERRPFRHVNPHRELDELLWMLMTDEKKEYWFSWMKGMVSPAENIQTFGFGM